MLERHAGLLNLIAVLLLIGLVASAAAIGYRNARRPTPDDIVVIPPQFDVPPPTPKPLQK